MDKQKEIEEMASSMANCNTTCDECFERLERVMTMKIKEREKYCQAYMFAKTAVEQGYRNCKDKVVLSREEYENLTSYNGQADGYINGLEYELEQARKETAEEILKELIKNCQYTFNNVGKPIIALSGDFALNIAKQYGVEIGE